MDKDVLKRLYSRRTFGIKLGLDVEKALLEELGRPQDKLAVIHVAGTNGKGSVSAIIGSILTSAGLKCGLYTSPHLVNLNERFQIDGVCVSDEKLFEMIEEIEKASDKAKECTDSEATFFECTTAMALKYFSDEKVDIAVIETGMGGRLDATNVVEPVISVITRISMEHAEHLGDNLTAIAGEKSGIIKNGRPVVCGANDDEAVTVVRKVAQEKGSTVVDASQSASVKVMSRKNGSQVIELETSNSSYGRIEFPLFGFHQIENLATAICSIEVLSDILSIEFSSQLVNDGIKNVSWPGRMQIIAEDPPVFLDGAHNPGASEALAKSLKSIAEGKPLALVIGMCSDKDVKRFLKPFQRIATNIWVVPVAGERNMPAGSIVQVAENMGFCVKEATVSAGIESAIEWGRVNDGIVCITGSLFLVGEVLRIEGL